MLRVQSLTHLGLAQVLTPGALQMHLRPIHDQKTKRSAFLFSSARGASDSGGKRTMFLGQPLKPVMQGGVTHRLTRDPLHLLSSSTVKNMDAKTNGSLNGILQNMVVGRNGKSLHQRSEGSILFAVHKLRKLKGNRPMRRTKPPGLTLMTIVSITLGFLSELLLNDLLLKGLHQDGKNGSMNLRAIRLQPLNQPVDCHFGIWHLKDQAKVHCDLAQWIPPFFGYANPFIKAESVSFFKRRNYSPMAIT